MSHVHEGHGIEKICHTVYVNSALTDNRYKLAYSAKNIDIDGYMENSQRRKSGNEDVDAP